PRDDDLRLQLLVERSLDGDGLDACGRRTGRRTCEQERNEDRLPHLSEYRRSRCGTTVYFGSRADAKPALKTPQRRSISPARTRVLPPTAAERLCRPFHARRPAPAATQSFEARVSCPESPFLYGSASSRPTRCCMTSIAASSAAAHPIASRRAGPASSGGSRRAAAAPAVAVPLAPKSHGSSCRPSCQTGTEVLASSAPV